MKMQRHQDVYFEHEVAFNPTLEIVFLVAMGVLLLAYLGTLGYQLSLGTLPFKGMTYTFSSLIVVHAVYMLGWRRALAFLAITVVISFLFEYVGVKTGWIFGRYYYTAVLDPKILGTVPMVIPLAYFMVIYPSYMIANLVVRGRPTGGVRNWAWILFSSLLTALVMSAWDLSMDPVMVSQVKAWVWLDGGPYFGIPFHNFLGWVLTTFTASVLYRFAERALPMHSLGRGHRLVLLLPLLGYAALCVGGLFVGYPVDTRLVSTFTMGVPVLMGIIKLYGPE